MLPTKIMKTKNHTPWFLSETLFGVFFTSTLVLVLGTFLFIGGIYAVTAVSLLNQDYSKGILPPIEKALCGEPGCLKTYMDNNG